jgi:hypothetical protein
MTGKERFAQRGREMSNVIASINDDLQGWYKAYFDRAYTLTDADVEAAGVTATDVVGLVTFAEALATFMTSNGGYISKMRSDL